jgi:hypothetical protein
MCDKERNYTLIFPYFLNFVSFMHHTTEIVVTRKLLYKRKSHLLKLSVTFLFIEEETASFPLHKTRLYSQGQHDRRGAISVSEIHNVYI